MKFYGTESCIKSWKKIVETDLKKECSETTLEPIHIDHNDTKKSIYRAWFNVDMTKEDRDYLQENYWYVKEEGNNMNWNMRVGFTD